MYQHAQHQVQPEGAAKASSTFLASDGEGYEAQMGRWSRRLAPLLIEFAELPASAGHVLDAGCGTGSLTVELSKSLGVRKVTGVDVSVPYVTHAKSQHCGLGISFDVGDVIALQFDNGFFDHSFSSLVLQFVPEADRAIGELCRVTRPGGVVAAATWDTRGGVVMQRMFFDTAAVLDPAAARYRAASCARPLSRRDGLLEAWRGAGMTGIEMSDLTIRMDFASFEDFWSSIDGRDGPYAAYLKTLSATAKTTLRHFVEAAYCDGEPDGPRSYAATALAIKGRVP